MALVLDLTTGLFSGEASGGNPPANQAGARDAGAPQPPVPKPGLREHAPTCEQTARALTSDLAATDAATFVRAMARKAR